MIIVFQVSIIIPTKDRANYIERSLKSVLNQHINNIEVIIVDDGSVDETKSIIFDYQREYNFIRYIKNETSVGGATARNQGADLATGQFVAFLDSDDEWCPNHLTEGLELIKRYNAEGIYGSFYIQKGVKRFTIDQSPTHSLSIAERIFSENGDARTSTFIFKKNAFDKIKFDEKQHKHQDWDLAIRFEYRFPFVLNPKQTVILHYDVYNRMSSKVNYEATDYLISKHKNKVSKKALAHFYISIMWRCLKNDGKTNIFIKYKKELIQLLENRGIDLVKKDKQKVLLMRLPSFLFVFSYKIFQLVRHLKGEV